MTPHDPQVLVVGGGPTGLLTAGELARRGIAVRLIEKHPFRQQLSKALVVQARTLEVMDIIGISEHFLKSGYPAPGLNISLDNRRPVSVDMRALRTRFPYLLVLPQQETEEILETYLSAHGASMERGLEARHVEQVDGAVDTYVQTPDDTEQLIRSRYLVACDGAHSTVRARLGVPFVGREQDYIVFLADVKLVHRFNKARITNFTSARGFLSILPFLGEYARIFAVDFTKQKRSATETLTLADLQDTVDAIAPIKLDLGEPRWITRFLSPSRQVPNSRYGRVFFVGDAAHAHSPAGGQGMNNGLQDAFNLAWKLAMALNGEAPESLLETYNLERHPVDAEAQRRTDLMFRSFTLRNRVLKSIRNVAIRTLVPIPSIQRKLSGDLSGISVSYRFTKQSHQDRERGRSWNKILAGDRLPDVELWKPDQPCLRLYELLRGPGYVLLAYTSIGKLDRCRHELETFTQFLRNEFVGAVRPFIVLDEGVPDDLDKSAPVLVDFKGQFRSEFQPDREGIFFVRPDGYLAFANAGFEWSDDVFLAWVCARNKDKPSPNGSSVCSGLG
jgi:2-polyprenyl-6-methoxyphenol hydroxylase-like FAD-dependent oxidoreductase